MPVHVTDCCTVVAFHRIALDNSSEGSTSSPRRARSTRDSAVHDPEGDSTNPQSAPHTPTTPSKLSMHNATAAFRDEITGLLGYHRKCDMGLLSAEIWTLKRTSSSRSRLHIAIFHQHWFDRLCDKNGRPGNLDRDFATVFSRYKKEQLRSSSLCSTIL